MTRALKVVMPSQGDGEGTSQSFFWSLGISRVPLRVYGGRFASLRMTELSMDDEFKTLRKFDAGKGRDSFLYSLPALQEQGIGKISRLPVSIRIVLESVLRNCDGQKGPAQRCRSAGKLEREITGERGDSIRRCAHRLAGFHRGAAGG